MKTKVKKGVKLLFISKVCLSACLIFSLNSCKNASSDISAIKNIIEQDAERAYQQKTNLEKTLQIRYDCNTSKYDKLVNKYYKELNENTNNVLGLIDDQRKNLENGNNVDNELLKNSIDNLLKNIDSIYEVANRETGSHNDLQKNRENTEITKVSISKFFNNLDNSSKEVKDLLLTKLASDIINTEVTVTNNLYDAYKNSGRINAILVVPEKTEHKVGENYEARVYLATKDTTKPAEVIANGASVKDEHIVIPCTKVGENIVEGSYTIMEDDGTLVQYIYQSIYTVTKH